jgi:hypothetical protein
MYASKISLFTFTGRFFCLSAARMRPQWADSHWWRIFWCSLKGKTETKRKHNKMKKH